jgi:hypothetical protein
MRTNWGTLKTTRVTIGGVGVAGCDFNFATAANQNEQPIDLGHVIPAKAIPLNVYLFTDAVFTGAISLVADVGLTTGAADFIASATIYAANAVLAPAAGGMPYVPPLAAAQHVWVNAIPGANWSLVTAGRVSVYITYVDVTNL